MNLRAAQKAIGDAVANQHNVIAFVRAMHAARREEARARLERELADITKDEGLLVEALMGGIGTEDPPEAAVPEFQMPSVEDAPKLEIGPPVPVSAIGDEGEVEHPQRRHFGRKAAA